jgi:ribose 5-phosphate isomerase A
MPILKTSKTEMNIVVLPLLAWPIRSLGKSRAVDRRGPPCLKGTEDTAMESPMTAALSPADTAKRAAALLALDFVTPGMKLGLGTGSTADWFTKALGERVRAGALPGLVAVPTSEATARLAAAEVIALAGLDEAGALDLTIDGADEFDPALTLVKGGGGALLREKIVASASARMVVIADATKRVATLGAFPLPVEIVPFGAATTQRLVERVLAASDVDGRRCVLRERAGAPFVTDGGHYILDLHLGRIGDAAGLATALLAVPGVVETGLFIGLADTVVLGHPSGDAEVLSRPAP